jgi:raffinose/stachyose/melibiose transport system permease protein
MRNTSTLLQKKYSVWAAILLGIYGFMVAIPLSYVFINSFKTFTDIQYRPLEINPAKWTFDNYIKAWTVMDLGKGFLANLIFLILSLLFMITAGSLMGFAVVIVRSKFLKIAYNLVILVITIPFQAIMIPVVVLMKTFQLLNSYVGTSLLFAACSMPIVVFLYSGAIKSIPRELCEAAVVDGCGIMQTFLKVYFPLLNVITGTVLIIRGTSVWNDMLINMITVTDNAKRTVVYRLSTFLSTRISQWDFVFGAVVIISLPIVIVFFLLQKSFISGITSGAVKG